MNHQFIINKLEHNLDTFKSLFISLSQDQAIWKPNQDKWSLLEVLNHLYDEERYDFRQRIDFALLQPDKEWKQIQPVKWCEEKHYNLKDFSTSLDNFLSEREKSIHWLRKLHTQNWDAVDNYPFGIILSAKQALVNWLAHDYLHMRQIIALNWKYLELIAPSTDLNYAGDW